MRIQINNEDYEVRVQQRTVTFCDIMSHGKLVSKGIAIENPQDVAEGNISFEIGTRIAANRALQGLGVENFKGKASEIVAKVKGRTRKEFIQKFIKKMFDNVLTDALKFGVTRGTGFAGIDYEAQEKAGVGGAYYSPGYDVKIVQDLPKAEVDRRYPGWEDLDNRPKVTLLQATHATHGDPVEVELDNRTVARRILGFLR